MITSPTHFSCKGKLIGVVFQFHETDIYLGFVAVFLEKRRKAKNKTFSSLKFFET
jgi:hypothetical protein